MPIFSVSPTYHFGARVIQDSRQGSHDLLLYLLEPSITWQVDGEIHLSLIYYRMYALVVCPSGIPFKYTSTAQILYSQISMLSFVRQQHNSTFLTITLKPQDITLCMVFYSVTRGEKKMLPTKFYNNMPQHLFLFTVGFPILAFRICHSDFFFLFLPELEGSFFFFAISPLSFHVYKLS